MRFRLGKGILVHAALVLGALAWSQAPEASYDSAADSLYASETVAPKGGSKPKEKSPSGMPKCPDGGERVPEKKRSPYDSLAPLSPLVA